MPTKDPQLVQIASTAVLGTLASIFLSYDPNAPKKPKIKTVQDTVRRFLVGFIIGCLVVHFLPNAKYLNIAATSCGTCAADFIFIFLKRLGNKIILDPIKCLKDLHDIWRK